MNEKQIRARVQHKHKTEAQWLLDVYTDASMSSLRDNPFIPLAGELIIFEKDDTHENERFKFGDGETNVMDLLFASAGQPDWNQNDGTKADFIKNRTHYSVNNTAILTWEDHMSEDSSVNEIPFPGFITNNFTLTFDYGQIDDFTVSTSSPLTQTYASINEIPETVFVITSQSNDGSGRVTTFEVTYNKDTHTFHYPIQGQNEAWVTMEISGDYLTQLDSKYIPIDNETITIDDGKIKANSPQADWNQNDETKVDYIKNRTHYSNVEYFIYPTIVDVQTDEDDTTEFSVDPIPLLKPLSSNTEYVVTYKGQETRIITDEDGYTNNKGTTIYSDDYDDPDTGATGTYEIRVRVSKTVLENTPSAKFSFYLSGGFDNSMKEIWNSRDNFIMNMGGFTTDFSIKKEDVTQLHSKFIPIDNETVLIDDNGKLKASLSQADWNQIDETKADFIKNKPFGIISHIVTNPCTFDDVITDEDECNFTSFPLESSLITINLQTAYESGNWPEDPTLGTIRTSASLAEPIDFFIEVLPTEPIEICKLTESVYKFVENEEGYGEWELIRKNEIPGYLYPDGRIFNFPWKGVGTLSWFEIRTIYPAFLPIQNSDWEQNDTTGREFIKNRTHYEYEGYIINNQTIATAGYSQVLPRALKPNTIYTITIDGDTHTLRIPSEKVLLENKLQYVTTYTKNDYSVTVTIDENEIIIDPNKTITFSLYGLKIKQLDAQYLPIPLHAGDGEKSLVQNDGSEYIQNDNKSNYTNATHAVVFGNNNRIYETDFGAEQNGENSFIGGGLLNTVHSANSFIGGGKQNTIGSNEGWAQHSAIVGGSGNKIEKTISRAFIGGGEQNLISAGGYSAILGGKENKIHKDNYGAIVGGCQNQVTGNTSSIIGGYLNEVNAIRAAIVGSESSKVLGQYGAVIGGYLNKIKTAGLDTNKGNGSVILGGYKNTIEEGVIASVICGGHDNITFSNNCFSAGYKNTIHPNASFSFVEGYENTLGGRDEETQEYITSSSSHIEGQHNKGTGIGIHIEGYNNTVDGNYAHAGGYGTKAIGNAAFSHGVSSEANGRVSFAHGDNIKINVEGGTGFGKFNKTTDAAFVIGNGTSNTARKDAFKVSWDGVVTAGGLDISQTYKNADRETIGTFKLKSSESSFICSSGDRNLSDLSSLELNNNGVTLLHNYDSDHRVSTFKLYQDTMSFDVTGDEYSTALRLGATLTINGSEVITMDKLRELGLIS